MAYAGPRVPTMAIYRVCFTEAPESAAFLQSKKTSNEEGQISRYSHSRAQSPCDGFEAAPEHVERSCIIDRELKAIRCRTLVDV